MMTTSKVHPHDVGLPEPIIRKRRRSRRLATIMLTIALITAAAGWIIFGNSIFSAIRIREQPPSLAIIAYGFLIISSVTLVLGLWYLLLAQVDRVARMVDAAELDEAMGELHCPHCRRLYDTGDRFCRHCGVSLNSAPPRGSAA